MLREQHTSVILVHKYIFHTCSLLPNSLQNLEIQLKNISDALNSK